MAKKQTQLKSPDAIAWILLLILSVIWGSSFILIKKALVAFTPMQVGSARVVIAFLAFLPLFFYYLKEINWRLGFPLFIVGLCGSGLPALLYAYAQTSIPSAAAGLLNALTPIFTFLLAILFFGRKARGKHLLGILVGFVGTAVIFLTRAEGSISFPIWFGMAIVLATFCYGISANTVSSRLQGVKPLIISTVSFVVIGPWMLIYLVNTDFFTIVQTHEAGYSSLLALMILSLVGTFAANILFFRLIQMTDSVFASSVSFITPLVAILWGYLDGEAIPITFLIALLLIFTGVYLIKFESKKGA